MRILRGGTRVGIGANETIVKALARIGVRIPVYMGMFPRFSLTLDTPSPVPDQAHQSAISPLHPRIPILQR